MHWVWLDRILTLEVFPEPDAEDGSLGRCVAIKNVSSAEDVLHDHFEATEDHGPIPVMPNSLIIEGMAQTAGILTGKAGDFQEKVILAKIGSASFQPNVHARPGFCIRHRATLERFGPTGSSTKGQVDLIDPATGQSTLLAEIDLMFSHIDQNRAGLEFPEHNFVFSSNLMDLLQQSGLQAGS